MAIAPLTSAAGLGGLATAGYSRRLSYERAALFLLRARRLPAGRLYRRVEICAPAAVSSKLGEFRRACGSYRAAPAAEIYVPHDDRCAL